MDSGPREVRLGCAIRLLGVFFIGLRTSTARSENWASCNEPAATMVSASTAIGFIPLRSTSRAARWSGVATSFSRPEASRAGSRLTWPDSEAGHCAAPLGGDRRLGDRTRVDPQSALLEASATRLSQPARPLAGAGWGRDSRNRREASQPSAGGSLSRPRPRPGAGGPGILPQLGARRKAGLRGRRRARADLQRTGGAHRR